MSLALVPRTGDQPSVIRHQGGWVYIGVHDAEYRRIYGEWRQRLAGSHTDRTGKRDHRKFVAIARERDLWLLSEREWYAEYGLEPPSISEIHRRPTTVQTLKQIERDALMRALEAAGGQQKRAAELLGISPRVLDYKMRRHRIRRHRDVSDPGMVDMPAVCE